MKYIIGLLTIVVILAGCAQQVPLPEAITTQDVQVFKSPNCGCCNGHVTAYEQAGFSVDVTPVADMELVKERHEIPQDMKSCHTAVVGKYFVEGHVPMQAVEKLLLEQPDIDGISLPGMPIGTPGMPGPKRGDWIVYALKDGQSTEFMVI